jgi:hypothetical protein
LAVALLGGGCRTTGDNRDHPTDVDRDRELQRVRDEEKTYPYMLNNFQPSNGEQAYLNQQAANRTK